MNQGTIVVVGIGAMGSIRFEALLQLKEAGFLKGFSVGVYTSESSIGAGNLNFLQNELNVQVRRRYSPREDKVQVFFDYQDVLNCQNVAGVILSVPTSLHSPYACQALEAGKGVFIERPFALTVERTCDVLERHEDLIRRNYHPILAVSNPLQYCTSYQTLSSSIASMKQCGEEPKELALSKLIPSSHRYVSSEFAAEIGSPWLNQSVEQLSYALQMFGDPDCIDIDPECICRAPGINRYLLRCKAFLCYGWGNISIEAGISSHHAHSSSFSLSNSQGTLIEMNSGVSGREIVSQRGTASLVISGDLPGITSDVQPYAKELLEFVHMIRTGEGGAALSPYAAGNAVQLALEIEDLAFSIVRSEEDTSRSEKGGSSIAAPYQS